MEYIGSMIRGNDVISFQRQQQQQMYYPSFEKPFIYPNFNKKRRYHLKFGDILYKMAWIGLCISIICLIADSSGIFAFIKKYILQLLKRKDLKEFHNSLVTLSGKDNYVQFSENNHSIQNISSETDNQIEQSVEFNSNNNINQDTNSFSPIINNNEQIIESAYPYTTNMKRQERRNRYKNEEFLLSPSNTTAEGYVHGHDQQQQQIATDFKEEETRIKSHSQKAVKQLTKKNSATASKLKPWERKKKKQTSEEDNIFND